MGGGGAKTALPVFWSPTGLPTACNRGMCYPRGGGGWGGLQAGHKALHTCTSWYAYVAMFGSLMRFHLRSWNNCIPSFVVLYTIRCHRQLLGQYITVPCRLPGILAERGHKAKESPVMCIVPAPQATLAAAQDNGVGGVLAWNVRAL